ncbi:DUF262 domain-containing protein [Algoriphagus marinus]|uniref:DUF262 domain-containing protein n=1 Tax=Algoriphagus marinus TaxID=1925762 RepID=UPI00094B7AF2|nr:DUF262 domain-containing protein [Algoriphagus marinus]
MSNNLLKISPVQDLLSKKYFIPAYQRGYRWGPMEVEALLKDIVEFKDSPKGQSNEEGKEPFYCLQPVVVKKSGKDVWEVIDGQQRLTTILLILFYFNQTEFKKPKPLYSLKYETREDSENFLAKIEEEDFARDNVDYFHIHSAYKKIDDWFTKIEKSNQAIKGDFYSSLINQVKVIWYAIEDDNQSVIDIFTRLNIGKIPLTNAELIKAMFLRKDNFDQARASLKQIQIAAEWDSIEQTLQQDEFWYFVYDTSNPLKYENRIEYIFDLMYHRKREHEYYYTFLEFVKEVEKTKDKNGKALIDTLWLEIKEYFLILEEWYSNREWYHLIGYLVACGKSVNDLKKETKNKTKSEFKVHLYDLIKQQVNFIIDDLEYGRSKDNEKIRKVLLLFNIQTLVVNSGADMRFPFHRYKKENWDIEHIYSQTDQELKGVNQKKAWIKDMLEYITGKSVNDLSFEGASTNESEHHSSYDPVESLTKKLLDNYREEGITNEIFDLLKKEVEAHYKVNTDEIESKDGISNLALLDDFTNRSYKNALFFIKRKKIVENDQVGKFVPICTKNVFLKYYSKQLDEVMHWKSSDAEHYLNAIHNTLSEFLPKEDKR